MSNNVKVSEVVLNFDKFTLVKMDTIKGPYQVSLRGHDISISKIERVAKSIEKIIKG